MTLSEVRDLAMNLHGSTESPHHRYTSFRVRGRIYATAPLDGGALHVFLDEEERDRMLLLRPDACIKLGWGRKTVGLRVDLELVEPEVVRELLRAAWRRKLAATAS